MAPRSRRGVWPRARCVKQRTPRRPCGGEVITWARPMPAPNASAEQRAQSRVGATLRDKYRLDRVLGGGGMAAVYLAVHRNGNRVAVKVLHPELSIEPELITRFVREGYLANSIDHPG